MDPSIDPPAIVRAAKATLKERAARVRALHKSHLKSALENAILLGSELQAAKDQCVTEGRAWTDWLREAEMSRTTADRNRRAFANKEKFLDGNGALCTTVVQMGLVEALNWAAGPDVPDEETTTLDKPVTCDRCQRVGPVKDCPQCAELLAAARGKKTREPGDDTDAEKEQKKKDDEAKKKQGKSVFDWPVIDTPFGQLVRALDTFGKAFGCKETPQVEGLRRMLSDWRETLKKVYKAVAKQQAPN